MKKIILLCDRCNKEITDEAVKLVVSGEDLGDISDLVKSQEEKEYCRQCIVEILSFANEDKKKKVEKKCRVSPGKDKKAEKSSPAVPSDKSWKSWNIGSLSLEKVMDLRAAGKTNQVIAEMAGTSPTTLSSIVSRYKRKLLEDMDVGKVKALYKAGWSVEDIADEMRVTPEVIRMALV